MSKFSLRAREVLHLAREEAQFLQNDYLDTEHLLLGLVREDEESAAHIFQSMGVDLIRARTTTEHAFGRRENLFSEEECASFTSEARRAFHLAADEAQKLQQEVDAEHLLLALTLLPESNANLVLHRLGISLDELRVQALQGLSPSESGSTAPPPSGSGERNRFNKFTQRARLALLRAEEEAWIFQQSHIGIEHLFLGLLCAGEGTAVRVLAKLDVNLNALEQAFVQLLCRQESSSFGLTPHSKKAIALAVKEAVRFGHHYLGTEHLLLGMIRADEDRTGGLFTRFGLSQKRQDEDPTGRVFANFGLNLKYAREKTLSVLLTGATDDPRQDGSL